MGLSCERMERASLTLIYKAQLHHPAPCSHITFSSTFISLLRWGKKYWAMFCVEEEQRRQRREWKKGARKRGIYYTAVASSSHVEKLRGRILRVYRNSHKKEDEKQAKEMEMKFCVQINALFPLFQCLSWQTFFFLIMFRMCQRVWKF